MIMKFPKAYVHCRPQPYPGIGNSNRMFIVTKNHRQDGMGNKGLRALKSRPGPSRLSKKWNHNHGGRESEKLRRHCGFAKANSSIDIAA